MELPPYLRHPPRYVSHPHRPLHPPPPPPPPNLSEDRNFYPQHLFRPPPPPPIPTLPQSYRPLSPAPPPPPGRPYSPHQSQFTFPNHRPIEDDLRRPRLDFPLRSPPRVFDRPQYDDDRPRHRITEFDNPFPDRGPDSWVDPPKVPPENRVPFCVNRESIYHHGSFNNQIPLSPFRTDNNHRRDLQGNFRFRGDYIDGFKSSHTEEFLLGRTDRRGSELDSNYRQSHDHHVSNSSGSSRNFAFGDSHVVSKSNPSRDFGSNLGNYELYHGFVLDSDRLRNDRDENWRWHHARPPSRELPDAPVELENNEFGNDDGLQVVSSRRLPHNYDSGKFNFRGNREGNQEFHSPRKKIQKKSALLRIQFGKPHTRNRNDELRFPSVRSDDSDPSTFRSRGPFVYSNNRKDEDREGSPVEADVSFKSNALVAKAIVASSSHGIESDRTLTQANRKIRKTPEIDILNSPINKFSDAHGELSCSTRALDCPSISFKDSKQSEENAMNYGSGAVHGIGSQPCSSSTIDSPGNNTLKELVSDKVGNTVGSDGTSSLEIRKKMKVIDPLSYLSKSQEANVNVQPVKADGSINSPPAASHPDEVDLQSEQTTASPAMVLVHNVGLQPYPNEVNALTDCNKVDESSRNIASENNGTGIDSGGSNVHNTKIKSNGLAHHLLDLPSSVTSKADEGTLIADGSIGSPPISNFDKDSVELPSGSTFNVVGEVGDISQQSCQNVTPVLLRNNLVKGYLEADLSGGNANTDFSSSEKIIIHNGPVSLCSMFDDVHNASNSDSGLVSGQLTKIVSDIDIVDPGSELTEATVLPENVSFEGFPKAIPAVEDNAILGLSGAEETIIHACDLNNCATGSSGSDNMLINSQWKIPASEIENDDSSNVSCPDVANVLIEPSNTWVSARSNLHDGFVKGCAPNKRKDREIQLDLSSPSTSELPMNAVSIVNAIDGNLSCPAKDFNLAEEKAVVSAARNFDAGLPPCTDKDGLADGYCLTVGSYGNEFSVKGSFKVGQDGSSPQHTKKRKICGPVSPIPILSEAQEESVSNGTSTFSMDLPSNNDGIVMQSEEGGASFVGIGLVGEGFTNNVSKHQQVSPCPSGLGGEQKEKDALVMNTMNRHVSNIDMEKGGVFKKVAAAVTVEEIGMLHIETVQQRNPSETLASDTDQRQPVADMECSNAQPLNADSTGVSSTNLHDKTVEPAPDTQSNVDFPETLPVVTGSQMFNTELSLGQILKEKGHKDLREDEKNVCDGLSLSCSLNTPLHNTAVDKKSSYAVGSVHSINAKFVPQDASKTTHSLNSVVGGIDMRKNQLTSVVPRVFPGHLSLKKAVPSSQIARRTWHRTGNPSASSVLGKNSYPYPVPPQGQPPSKMGKDPSASYIRKGNSLVRKPSPVAAATDASHAFGSSVCQLNPSSMDGMNKKVGVKSMVSDSNPPSSSGTGLNATLERPKTPPVPCNTKLSNCTTFSSGNGTSSPSVDPPTNGCSETDSDLLKFKENVDAPKPSEDDANSSGPHENQTSQINNFENHSVLDDENSVSMKTRKMVYVKRKSNQLVAASSSSDLSVQNVDKTEALSSDGYYKRRKNQLVRKSSGVLQKFVMSDNSLNLEGRRGPQIVASSSSRRQSGKGLAKTYKPSKFSLVWTLGDAQSLKKENMLLCEVWPHLFPWKRATYWRSLVHNSASIPNNSSLSTISPKLLLSRKRETIYRRSTRGLSLRISKVLSVGGSSLKWSKSIERNSKKVNEEATLAVAAVEKKKREQNGAGAGAGANAVRTKGRSHSFRKSVHCIELRPGERIFRVGSVRYKMDPTRRTLQRISDKELSDSTALQSGEDEKKSSIPKRLLIGNDEYVRIGNGNQLIRDPKKRTRILASEKVRWSLHTARLRLARKNKYCQFFTRFGKCNKDDGKCSYIHDPSKIAVCTKFLKGACCDPNCKLTHKVIPERMQDCSYFLRGLCTNESCPYRHVNVNPNASICEGFLRGYCADGNECRMKHSYVCPMFEATGICPQGSNCKLHHPKSRSKGKKRKPSRQRKNAQGRYFGSRCIDISECRAAVVLEKHSAKEDDDIFYQEGKFAEYIHLDAGDEKFEELNEPANEQLTSCDDNPTDIQVDVDMLIKPLYIMSKNLVTESSPAVDSLSEKTAGNVSEESSCK